MMLSELIEKSQHLLDKYGDRRVFVDTEAMEYICHWAEPTDINTVLSEQDMDEDPLLITEQPFDVIVIHLDDRVKKIPK